MGRMKQQVPTPRFTSAGMTKWRAVAHLGILGDGWTESTRIDLSRSRCLIWTRCAVSRARKRGTGFGVQSSSRRQNEKGLRQEQEQREGWIGRQEQPQLLQEVQCLPQEVQEVLPVDRPGSPDFAPG